MSDEDLYFKVFMASLAVIFCLFIGAVIGWEGFKLTHQVICPETLERCVSAPWS